VVGRRAAVDAGRRALADGWTPEVAGCVGHRLWHAVRLHDFRSIWSQFRCRARIFREPKPLVIVGNGMAAARLVDELTRCARSPCHRGDRR